jgi:hypothetical protein
MRRGRRGRCPRSDLYGEIVVAVEVEHDQEYNGSAYQLNYGWCSDQHHVDYAALVSIYIYIERT